MDSKEPKIYQMEAANGMIVDVPEDKLESWLKGQEEIRSGKYKADAQLRDKIKSMIYKSKK